MSKNGNINLKVESADGDKVEISAGAAAAQTPVPDEHELQALRDKAAEADRLRDVAMRAQAEFDNYQKRIEKQRHDEKRYAIAPFVRELLATVDNLERAIASAAKSPELAAHFKGVEMTHTMLLQSLERFGVVAVNPIGEQFNPELHEAVMTASDETKDDNAIIECFEKGWQLHERVIRAAKVKVNKKL